ncbi:hypothetical protein D9611_006060 [Ephemerocybe angulata]|uniref:Fungal-type protein kinase domain-containing protein n=1 Tax=Ephemerocybe angulata TaxID=980116 RepID=A0A8H5CHH6_9AGAR|nr:hypothetical protein D9611_006060 [Tulosesus angulatus]
MPAPNQPKNGLSGNASSANALQRSSQRPLTRSVTAANRGQQSAPAKQRATPSAPVAATPPQSDSHRLVSRPEPPPGSPKETHPINNPETESIKTILAAQRRAALSDLHELHTVEGSDLKNLYKNIASDRIIDAFFAKSKLYDLKDRVWVDIVASDSEERMHLTSRFVGVIKTIIDELGHSKGTREVVDARNTKFWHLDDRTQSSNPCIAINAAGPSFSLPNGGDGIGFDNVASLFDVKLDADVCEDDVDHLAVYNRSLLLTETRVRLVHCDRSGGYKTTWLNIHDDPHTFIRLVLGLSSPRESVLGLDTSVQWTIKNGAKVAGTIATLDTSGKKVKHQLMMGVPYFVKYSVRGPGTVCWFPKDKAGRRILIKDAWRTDAQVPEYTFLERAKGMAGVAQMLAVEDDRFQTKTLRTNAFDFASPDLYKRTMCRLTMECYGAPLHKFTSQRQALVAIRDAIQGHWDLLQAGILHRDVSIDNILIGEPSAPVGRRGVLIDLEMAILTGNTATAREVSEVQAGTYLYQSLSILRNGSDEEDLVRIAHDYLDDLESFFWVLCHLLHGYDGVDSPVANAFNPKSVLGRFENPDALDASNSKQFYLTLEGPARRGVPVFWSEATVALGENFRAYIFDRTEAKLKCRWKENYAVQSTMLEDLYTKVHYQYHDIIGLFDVALETLEKLGEAPRPSTPSPSFFPGTPRKSANKRKAEEDLDATPAKGHRSASFGSSPVS